MGDKSHKAMAKVVREDSKPGKTRRKSSKGKIVGKGKQGEGEVM
jgi:hypothetical protein